MNITAKDRDRAYRFFVNSSAEEILAAVRAGSDPAMEELVLDALRSSLLVGPTRRCFSGEDDSEPLIGKDAVHELIQGEWETLSNTVFNPGADRMDKETWQYLHHMMEVAMFLLQNIEMLRGGKPNQYWFDEGAYPAAFWSEYDEMLKGE